MRSARKLSILLLVITSLLGLLRGYRMMQNPVGDSVLFPYPEEILKVSVFSNYYILGWIVFCLIGIFSILALAGVIWKMRNYAYLIIVEAIFLSFLTLTHIVITQFALIHIVILLLCLTILVLGILQTPREF